MVAHTCHPSHSGGANPQWAGVSWSQLTLCETLFLNLLPAYSLKETKGSNEYQWVRGERENSKHCWWNWKLVSPLWKLAQKFFQKWKLWLPLGAVLEIAVAMFKDAPVSKQQRSPHSCVCWGAVDNSQTQNHHMAISWRKGWKMWSRHNEVLFSHTESRHLLENGHSENNPVEQY